MLPKLCPSLIVDLSYFVVLFGIIFDTLWYLKFRKVGQLVAQFAETIVRADGTTHFCVLRQQPICEMKYILIVILS